MSDFWMEPWFWPAVAVVVGLPILILLCTEIANALQRRGNPAAKVVRLIRNFVLPLGALLVLLFQLDDLEAEVNWTRIIATMFGFTIILVLLNSVNVVLFSGAKRGSWRERLPSIFVDIARLLIIVVSLAALFAWVWGADVGGLFTALGVSSIVIGLALQNAAGSVVSGLLLLFEQPFQLGDWLDTGGVQGRVVEVNWRAVHIETGNGIEVVPTASLAGSSFRNLSRTGGSFDAELSLTFSTDDAPHDVLALVRRVAGGIPNLVPGANIAAYPTGGGKYAVTLPVASPADAGDASALFLTWLWYAARRSGLHLDNDLTDDYLTPQLVSTSLRRVAPVLHVTQEEAEALADSVTIERFGAGEYLQLAGDVPDRLQIIVSGKGTLLAPDESSGTGIPFAQLTDGDTIGLTAFTRQPSPASCFAQTDVTVVSVPVVVLDTLVRSHPGLALDIGKGLDNRRAQAAGARELRLSKTESARREG